MPFDGYSQQTKDGCSQCYEDTPLTHEPLSCQKAQSSFPRHQHIYSVHHTGKQVTQREIPNEKVHAAVELMVFPYRYQHYQVLQDYEAGYKQKHHLLGAQVSTSGGIFQPSCVIVMFAYAWVCRYSTRGRFSTEQ